jgi:acetylornithine deacetylase/succinyl-diaminopimelate desuccinylase-like protein
MPIGPSTRAFLREGLRGGQSRKGRSAQQVVATLSETRGVHEAFAWFRSHSRELEDLQLEVTAIPAPPWGEAARSEWLAPQFERLGLAEVHQDELGNVFGIRPGTRADAPFVALAAHMDTVFSAGTEISVHREAGKLYGPGISDNSSGIVATLAMAGALAAADIANASPILFIGSVGEEGEGDLRGMRHIFQQRRWLDGIGKLIAIDGAGADTIIAEGLGSRRYEITIRGIGGHSWSDFGVANPIVGLSRVIEQFTRTPVPAAPKTTYNIGTIQGGTSVNSIPQEAVMRVDTRSASVEELDKLEKALRDAVEETVASLPGRNRKEVLSADIKVIGDRPAADLPVDSELLEMIRAVDAQLSNTARIQRASTDANIPLSLGREAVAIGAGGSGGGAHTLHEWYDPAGRDLGLKRILLLTLGLSGISEAQAPDAAKPNQ